MTRACGDTDAEHQQTVIEQLQSELERRLELIEQLDRALRERSALVEQLSAELKEKGRALTEAEFVARVSVAIIFSLQLSADAPG